MSEVFGQPAGSEVVEPQGAGVSWAAVLGGAAASLALTLVLLSFGAGMGFAVVSPWGDSGISATTFKIGTGIYFIVMAMISSAVGGHLAGRLSSKRVGLHTAEVQFRDTAHGFLAWAVASVLGAILLASPASSLIGSTINSAAEATAGSPNGGPMAGYVDSLLRPSDPASQQQQADPRPELTRLLSADFRAGNDIGAPDRAYLAKVVAARTGLSQPDAEKRVGDVITQAKTDLDAARRAAMQTAIWLTLSLFIGAFSAALAAMEGGGLRDGTWKKKAYATTQPSLNRN